MTGKVGTGDYIAPVKSGNGRSHNTRCRECGRKLAEARSEARYTLCEECLYPDEGEGVVVEEKGLLVPGYWRRQWFPSKRRHILIWIKPYTLPEQ
jgi:hypothetical protein